VLTGDVTRVEFNKDSILNAAQEDVSGIPLGASKEDSLLRAEVALEDKYNPLTDAPEDDYALFPPVKGTISEGFDMRQKHYAVDVVTAKNAPVKNIADGTVIFSGWTAGTGFVMIIRHTNQLISVYKHNASLTKEEGDPVKSGEVIATVGNTGELTTGPHLHFELWRNGTPIDPTNFLDFD
ncbi:MAG: M23 family metallopeptidase, partial [Marinirhabdus sp.]